jgi:glucan phosphoethanolaminetransferase (alkaline phosphatase superfamily)
MLMGESSFFAFLLGMGLALKSSEMQVVSSSLLTLFKILPPLLLGSCTTLTVAVSITFRQHSLIQQLLAMLHDIVFEQTLGLLTFETHFGNYFHLRLNFGSKLLSVSTGLNPIKILLPRILRSTSQAA